jgi:hypothetical protein
MPILAQLVIWSPMFAFVGAMFLYCKVRPTPKIPALVYTAIILVCGVVGYLAGFGRNCGWIAPLFIGPPVSAFAILSIGSLILLLRDK